MTGQSNQTVIESIDESVFLNEILYCERRSKLFSEVTVYFFSFTDHMSACYNRLHLLSV